jgi:hypothetical protein
MTGPVRRNYHNSLSDIEIGKIRVDTAPSRTAPEWCDRTSLERAESGGVPEWRSGGVAECGNVGMQGGWPRARAAANGLKPAAGTATSPALGSRSSPGGASTPRALRANGGSRRGAASRERVKPGFARNEQRPGLSPFQPRVSTRGGGGTQPTRLTPPVHPFTRPVHSHTPPPPPGAELPLPRRRPFPGRPAPVDSPPPTAVCHA